MSINKLKLNHIKIKNISEINKVVDQTCRDRCKKLERTLWGEAKKIDEKLFFARGYSS